MNDITDPLSTVAEFSIGLAGFTGIIAAVSRGADADVALQRFRFMNLLITAFAPGFFAMFTICLIYLGVSEGLTLRISAVLLALYLCCWAAFVARNVPSRGVNPLLSGFLWVSSLSNIALQLAAAIFVFSKASGLYMLGLVVLLLQAAVIFAMLALATLRADE